MAESELAQLQLPVSGPIPDQITDDTNPLLPSGRAADRLRHFPEEVYDTSPEGHLAKFMMVLLGDAGAGQLRKALLRTRLQQTLQGTHFYALDRFYGALFDFRRSINELLTVNPQNEVTNDWQAEHAKDASYRSRIIQFARAITHGATPTGMELVAEAVFNVDCDVYENYVQADAATRTYGELMAAYPTYGDMEGINYGELEGQGTPVLSTRREFVVRPKRQVTLAESYDLARVLTKIKPADARFVIDWQGIVVHNPMDLRGIAADSEYWEVVTLIPDPNGPIVEPPLPPFSKKQGDSWTYNGDVVGVSAYAVIFPPVTPRSLQHGLAMDVTGVSQAMRALVTQWPFHGQPNQQWRIEPVGPGEYRLVANHSGQVLDVFEQRTADGTPLIQFPWHGGGNQRFRLLPSGIPGYYVIQAVHSGKVVTASITATNGAVLTQTTYAGAPSARQLWLLPNFLPTVTLSPTQRVYFADGSYQDYPPADTILPLRSVLAGRIVSDGILISGPYGGWRPASGLTLTTPQGSRYIEVPGLRKIIAYFFADWIPLEIVLLWIRDNPVDPYEFTANRHFWVSPMRHQADLAAEVVEVRLNERKLVNHITFETSRYPHQAIFRYFDYDLGDWKEVYRLPTTDSFPRAHSAWEYAFAGSMYSGRAIGHPEHSHSARPHWVTHDMKIPRVDTDRFQIITQRIPGEAPYLRQGLWNRSNEIKLPYTLAVRKATVGYRVDNHDDLLPFKNPDPIASTTNMVGQAVRFAGRHQAADGLLKDPPETWRCEPQPFNYAVVNLFQDVRDEDGEPSTVDRFFIDPTHSGCHITIYWSNDEGEPDYSQEDGGASFFEGIGWHPVPRDYVAQKGFLHLPPTRAKWFKFEFTNLVAEPYEVFIPIRRTVKIFSPATVEASRRADTGVGTEGRPPGLTSAISTVEGHRYSDAVETLAVETQTRREDSPTSAFYVRDPQGHMRLKEQSWTYGFQPYTQGWHAPRFSRYEVHQYQEVELFNTSKVGFFCGLRELVPYRLDHEADDDTKVYTDHFDDFRNIEPGMTWTFNPGVMSSGASTSAVAVSKPMNSRHKVKAIQFATQQSDAVQLIYDDEFRDPALSDSDWTDTDAWHKVGDANLVYDAGQNMIKIVRYATAQPATVTHTPGLPQDQPYPVFSQRTLTVADEEAAAETFGGLASGLYVHSTAGRIHGAARVMLDTNLTNPLVLQIVKQDGTVLAEQTATGRAGDRLEWYVSYAIPDPTVDQAVRVQVIQEGKSDDAWRVDTLSLFDDGIVWDFSVNGGSDWTPAYDIRNNPYGVVTFPAAGTQLVWRARATRDYMTISGIRIRPIYLGIHNARADGSHRGPNVSTFDHEPPIQQDPWWQQWGRPVPRYWFYAFKGLPLLPVAGAPVSSEFARYYSRTATDDVSGLTDDPGSMVIQGRSTEEQLSFHAPVSDSASRSGSIFNRTASDSVPEPTDETIHSVAPGDGTGLVEPPVNPLGLEEPPAPSGSRFLPDAESGDFEGGTTGVWLPHGYEFTPTDTLIENSTEQAHSGTHSLKIIQNVDNSNQLRAATPDPFAGESATAIDVTGMTGTVTLDAWAFADDPNVEGFAIEWVFWAADGSTVVAADDMDWMPASMGEWVHLPAPAPLVVPATAKYLLIRLIGYLTNVGLGTTMYWDDFGYTVT